MHIADPGPGKARTLGAAVLVFRQPREAVAHEAAVERPARGAFRHLPLSRLGIPKSYRGR